MMAAEEKDLERGLCNYTSGDSLSQTEKVADEGAGADGGCDLVQTAAQDPISMPAPIQLSGIHRIRSNNGHDYDDSDLDKLSDSVVDQDLPKKEFFEVSWDDGDSDPMNPRSMGLVRKWFIVITTCAGSFLV